MPTGLPTPSAAPGSGPQSATPRTSHASGSGSMAASGVLLIGVALMFLIAYSALAVVFDYPGILREPTEVILQRFAEGGSGLVAWWYAFALSAVLFVPAAVAVSLQLAGRLPARPGGLSVLGGLGAAVGAAAGLVQAVGLMRWPFAVTYLSAVYTDRATGPAERDAAAVVFQALHRYVGVGLGENLGFLLTAGWTVVVAVLLWQGRLGRRVVPLTGCVLALGIALGAAEPAGLAWAGSINSVAYALWAPWLIAVGVIAIRASRHTPTAR